MFLLFRPSTQSLDRFIRSQTDVPFSYPEVGASRGQSAPAGYTVDHNRIELGSGKEAYSRAVEAVRNWKMFDLGWTHVYPLSQEIKPGASAAVVVRHLGFWSLNAARIIYTIDENACDRRFGFAYGTLADHAERGEERFSVEWRGSDDSVWYDLLAFSRPRHPLAIAGYPLTRRLQKRFAADSKKAMVRACREPFS